MDTDTGVSLTAPPGLSGNYVVFILTLGSHLQPLLVCQVITPMFVSMQCEEQSLESAETTTHHLGKPLVLIYEV